MSETIDKAALTLAVSRPEHLALFCKIDGKNGPEPLSLWAGQLAAIAFVMTQTRGIILKARQLGITWAMALVALWFAINHPAQTCLVLSKGDREARVVLRRVRRLYASLPKVIRDAYPVSLGEKGGERFEIDHPEGPGAVVSLPGSGGRSETAHLLLLDEGAHWEDSEDRLAAVLPTSADVGRTLIFSTANGEGGVFWELWTGTNRDKWPGIFLDPLQRPDRDEAWVTDIRASLGDLGPQEYPMSPDEAFLATGRCAFDRENLAWYREHSCEPAKWRGSLLRDVMGVSTDPHDHGDWWVWEWPQPGRDYAMFADTSGGHGSDYSAVSIFDLASWDEVAVYHAKVEPHELAGELVKAGYLWHGPSAPALCVPENNNHGQAVIALMREWNYPRLYETEVLDKKTKKTTVTYGWQTSEQSRRIAIGALQLALRERTLGIRDAAAIAEMNRFIWVVINEQTGTGRYQADQGVNDDRVLKLAIAAAVLTFAQGAAPQVQPAQAVPHEPRVSSVTGY